MRHQHQIIVTPYGTKPGHHNHSTRPIQTTAISVPNVRKPPRAIVTKKSPKHQPPKLKSTPFTAPYRASQAHSGPVWTARTKMDTQVIRCCRTPVYGLEGLWRARPMVQGHHIRRRPNPRDILPLEALRLRCACPRGMEVAAPGSTVRSLCVASMPRAIVRETMASMAAPLGHSGISSSNSNSSNSNYHHPPKRRRAPRAGGACIRLGVWMAGCANNMRSMGSGTQCPQPLVVALEEEQRCRLEQARHGTRLLRPSVHNQYTVDI